MAEVATYKLGDRVALPRHPGFFYGTVVGIYGDGYKIDWDDGPYGPACDGLVPHSQLSTVRGDSENCESVIGVPFAGSNTHLPGVEVAVGQS